MRTCGRCFQVAGRWRLRADGPRRRLRFVRMCLHAGRPACACAQGIGHICGQACCVPFRRFHIPAPPVDRSGHLTVAVISGEGGPVGPRVHAVPFNDSEHILSNEAHAALAVTALTMLAAIFPHALEPRTVCRDRLRAVSVLEAANETALINIAVGSSVGTMPVHESVHPLAFVLGAVGPPVDGCKVQTSSKRSNEADRKIEETHTTYRSRARQTHCCVSPFVRGSHRCLRCPTREGSAGCCRTLVVSLERKSLSLR